MITMAIYGRLGGEPKTINTASGKLMVTGSLAVTISGRDSEVTEWFGIVAFGKTAEILQRHRKGELLSTSGRLQVNTWTTAEGEERRQLQVIADSIVSARSVRPGGGGGKKRETAAEIAATNEFYDDDIDF